MIHAKRTRSQSKTKIIFSTGALLFLIGFLGMIYNLWINPNESASDFLPENTIIFTEIETTSSNVKKLKEFHFIGITDDLFAKFLPNINSMDFIPWIGEKLSIALMPNNEFVLSAKYRSKIQANNFMKKFLIEGENFSEKNISGYTVYSPSFSSQISFIFKDKWLIVASSGKVIKNILNSEKKLSQSSKFYEINKDLPRKSVIKSYFNLEELTKFSASQLSAKKPFIQALSKTIPAFGFTIKIKDSIVLLNSKLITNKGVFSSELLKNTPNEVIPELTKYSPQDVLFFMNGYDLNSKYLHTKKFLEEFHPQFALIFDGILRAEFKKIFGENFDFKKDLLAHIKNQYAIIFNFADKDTPFVHFTLITGFGEGTMERNIEDMELIIKYAQQKYSTKIVGHSLPDGTSRKELVIADPDEINIAKKTEGTHEYFTAETEITDGATIPKQKFSYGFLNNFLIFSNHEDGIKEVFQAYDTNSNLTKNEDFRESVLFKFPASESYGFINTNKLATVANFSRETSDEPDKGINLISLIKSFRNISFARKTFSEEVVFSATLKKR
jgi:hypothetical protein